MKTKITKDTSNNKLIMTRDFAAPRADVWAAHTQSELLDKWWAPKPWRAVTKSMDFREGGTWLYYMSGPEGEKNWCKLDFISIKPQETFSANNNFCDEHGNNDKEMPTMIFTTNFSDAAGGTRVETEIKFSSAADIQKIIEMGIEEGFSMAQDNLEAMLRS